MTQITKLSNAPILAQTAGISDQQWYEMLIQSAANPIVNGLELPQFPSAELQKNTVGSSGATSLYEAFRVYCLIKQYAEKLGVQFAPNSTKVMDFGCGWGRMIRFFLKDIVADNLYGVDVDPMLLDVCNKTIPYGSYKLVNPVPPTQFADNSFDVIYAYSVFSHLSEAVHIQWIQEFARILKPDGILFVTTQARRFLDFCQSLRGREHDFLWHQLLAQSFVDIEAAYADYDSGKFLHSATGGGSVRDASFYGETLIPQEYVEREWTQYLQFCDFVDNPDILPQSYIVMQKSEK